MTSRYVGGEFLRDDLRRGRADYSANPSVKGSANGTPPGPGHRYVVHCLWPGPGATPLSPPYLER